MPISDPEIAEGTATVITWSVDKVLGGVQKALNWGWDRLQWAAAQDRYDTQIIKQYGEIRILGQTTPKPLQAIFTDVYVLKQPTALRRFSPAALREHLWNEDRSIPFRVDERKPAESLLIEGRHYYIQGKPGAGKTTLLKYLAVRESQQGRWGQCLGKIPIYVSLKEFSESGKTLIEFIIKQFDVCHFPEATPFIEGLLKNGKALVLFDGLDEVTKTSEAETDQRGQIAQTIEEFTHIYSDCHIVITCRIAATEYTFDPSFIYLEIADFAPDQVETFIRSWFWDIQNRDKSADFAAQMLKELDRPEHAGIRDLSRNPLLLTLLCLNYAETLSFPTRRVEIYDEALIALLKKWDTSRSIRRGSEYKTLSLGRKQQMFARIAYDGFLDDEILFEQSELEKRLLHYLVNVPEMPTAIDIDTESVLREIIEQHGIFTEQSRGLFSFSHLTFQEYYVAKHISEGTAPDNISALLARMHDGKWREVFLLAASLWPDATPFLVEFELALRRLIARSTNVITWLHWIDHQAAKSSAGYRQPATRWFYAHKLASQPLQVYLDDEANNDFDHDLTIDYNLAAYFDAIVSRTRNRTNVNDLSLPPALIRVLLLRMSDLSRERYPSLCNDLSMLIIPDEHSLPGVWKQFKLHLRSIFEAQDVFPGFKKLEFEVSFLLTEQDKQDFYPFDQVDIETLKEYFRVITLFSDCLKLSYTPDRKKFEERILLPSVLT